MSTLAVWVAAVVGLGLAGWVSPSMADSPVLERPWLLRARSIRAARSRPQQPDHHGFCSFSENLTHKLWTKRCTDHRLVTSSYFTNRFYKLVLWNSTGSVRREPEAACAASFKPCDCQIDSEPRIAHLTHAPSHLDSQLSSRRHLNEHVAMGSPRNRLFNTDMQDLFAEINDMAVDMVQSLVLWMAAGFFIPGGPTDKRENEGRLVSALKRLQLGNLEQAKFHIHPDVIPIKDMMSSIAGFDVIIINCNEAGTLANICSASLWDDTSMKEAVNAATWGAGEGGTQRALWYVTLAIGAIVLHALATRRMPRRKRVRWQVAAQGNRGSVGTEREACGHDTFFHARMPPCNAYTSAAYDLNKKWTEHTVSYSLGGKMQAQLINHASTTQFQPLHSKPETNSRKTEETQDEYEKNKIWQ